MSHGPTSNQAIIRPSQGLRALIALAVLALFAGSCLADAHDADSRIDAITCHIAALYSDGRIDAATYSHLHAMRSEAARAMTIWLHSGRGEHEARAALVILESAVPR